MQFLWVKSTKWSIFLEKETFSTMSSVFAWHVNYCLWSGKSSAILSSPLLYKCIHSDIFGAGLFLVQCMAKVWVKKQDTFKDWPSVKHPCFWFYSNETWWKWLLHEAIIFTKFHEDWTKVADFLLMANFWTCAVFSLRPYMSVFF